MTLSNYFVAVVANKDFKPFVKIDIVYKTVIMHNDVGFVLVR